MSEQARQTFLEKLNLRYPNRFKSTTKGTSQGTVIFPAQNKRFGDILITGDLQDWHDEDDYDSEADSYEEIGADFQDYREDISLSFSVGGIAYLLTPSEVFEYLELIFSDQLVLYSVYGLPSKRRYNGLYELQQFKNLVDEGKIRVSRNYKLCLWSDNIPL